MGKFFVADVKATYRLTDTLDIAVGVDTLFDYNAYAQHPLPARTFLATLQLRP